MDLEQFKQQILPVKEKLLRYAMGFLGDSMAAEDIVQEVFLRLWYVREKLTAHPNRTGLAIQITKNLCKSYLRTKNRMTDKEIDKDLWVSADRRPDTQLEEKDAVEQVYRVLETLPDLQKLIFRMKHVDGYEIEEIAEITKSTPEAVRMNLSRARRKIKEQILKME